MQTVLAYKLILRSTKKSKPEKSSTHYQFFWIHKIIPIWENFFIVLLLIRLCKVLNTEQHSSFTLESTLMVEYKVLCGLSINSRVLGGSL